MEIETAKLKQYLLGNLSAPEMEKIDLRIISDESLEENLNWAESELAEDFLEGTLTPKETELFNKNFLVSARREDLVAELARLKKYARHVFKTQAGNKVTGKLPLNFRDRLKSFFALGFRSAATAAVLVVVICLALGTVWKLFFAEPSSPQFAQADSEYEEFKRQDLTDLSSYGKLSNVSLFSGTFRDSAGGGGAKKLKLVELTENVFFRLALPFQAAGETTFNIQILKDRNVVFRQNQARVYQNPNGQEVRLIAPKSVLESGQFQIRLETASLKGSALIYNFTVE